MSKRMTEFCTCVKLLDAVVTNFQSNMYQQLKFLCISNKVQRYTTMQHTELNRLRSILQLLLNNGLHILCNNKLA